MIKKSLFALTLSGLVGCSSLSLPSLGSEPLYKISDQEMKLWIAESNKYGKCIYPQLKGLSQDDAQKQVYNKLSKEENMELWHMYLGILSAIIGENAVAVISSDKASQDYLSKKLKEFNNNNNTDELPTKQCLELKKLFNQHVSQNKQLNLQ
jgi:hypothetical protein